MRHPTRLPTKFFPVSKKITMSHLKRILQILWGREENLFIGIYFILLKRYYRTTFGAFKVPKTWTRPHFYSRFLTDAYEKEERTLVEQHIDTNDHVLELGGCVGVISCLTSKKIGKNQHCVVEANPHLLPYLRENRQRNHAHFQILEAAVTESDRLEFHLNRNMVGGSTERKTQAHCFVSGVPLSEVTERFGPFNALIMDIEGGEWNFLMQYRQELSNYQKLLIEFHPAILGAERIEALRAGLREMKFQCHKSINDVDLWQKIP